MLVNADPGVLLHPYHCSCCKCFQAVESPKLCYLVNSWRKEGQGNIMLYERLFHVLPFLSFQPLGSAAGPAPYSEEATAILENKNCDYSIRISLEDAKSGNGEYMVLRQNHPVCHMRLLQCFTPPQKYGLVQI